jgi:D-serine dehydratase
VVVQDLLDPLIDASFKGFPHHSAPLRRSEVGKQGWNVLRGDLPLPLAVIKRDVLAHNLRWMQGFASAQGLGLAPHGKTSMSPQLFRMQLDAGAWGMTFATVTQMQAGIAAGMQRCVIANQVFTAVDLQGIASVRRAHAGLRVIFLVDSLQQLDCIEVWQQHNLTVAPFEVLLEIGVAGGRTGCRTAAQALALAQRLHTSTAVQLVGVECYEGLAATGETDKDVPYANSLMETVDAVARACDAQNLFDSQEIILTAGGSAIFDLVARRLKPVLSRPVVGLLRSGCYVTHDQGTYKRMMSAVAHRTGCGDGLEAAMEVWASVQSCPEPGLVILAAGKRDLSYDWEMPQPLAVCTASAVGTAQPRIEPVDTGWKVVALNDQHAHLRGASSRFDALKVGDLVCLGISHPCTTFDKWRWMPVVDADYTVCDAIVTCF